MSETAVGCGIDFGSSNSAVALAFRDRVEVVGEADGRADQALVPSALYLHRDGTRSAGATAPERFFTTGHQRTICAMCSLARYGVSDCRQFRRAGSCNDSRLLWSVKRDLANLGFAGTNSWATDFPVTDLVTVTMALLRERAEAAAGAPVTRAVVGHPVVFAGAAGDPSSKANATARARLREAAARAGFAEVDLCPEPEAAGMAGSAGGEGATGTVLLADFGAGTYDVAVLDRTPSGVHVRALEGVDIGGARFDEIIFETVVAPALRLHDLPSWLFNDLKSLSGVMLLMADPDLPGLLERHGGVAARTAAAILFGGHAYRFFQAIEAAKIALSTLDATDLDVEVPGVRLRATVTRRQFETAAGPELDQLEATTRRALAAAGLTPAGVDVAAVTGGSSQIPVFQRMLRALCPQAELRPEAAFTSVVRGLGARARALWAQPPADRASILDTT